MIVYELFVYVFMHILMLVCMLKMLNFPFEHLLSVNRTYKC